VAQQKLSVRDTEKLVKASKATSGAEPKEKPGTVGNRAVVEELQRALGTKVKLTDKGGQGTIEIAFFSYQDLDRLLQMLRR